MAVARQGDLGTATIRVIANTTEFDYRLRRSLKNLSIAAATVGTAMAGANFLGSAVKEAAKLESVFARIKTIMDSPADEAFINPDRLRDLSSQLGVAATEIGEAAYLALSSGTAAKDVMSVVEESAKTALATNSTVIESVNATTSALNAFAKGGLTAKQSNDILFRSLQFGKGSMREFARYISNAIPIVSQLSDGSVAAYSDLSALGAASTLTGKTARVAFTGLKVAMQELNNESKGGGKAFKEVFGESFQQYIKRTNDLAGALIKFGKKVGGENLTNIFGAKEGAAAIQQILSIPEEQLKNIIDETAAASGVVDKAWGTVENTYAQQAAKLRNQWINLKSELGESLLPVANEVLKKTQEILAKARPKFQEFGQFLSDTFNVEAVGEFLADLGSAVDDAWNNHLKPFAEQMADLVQNLWPQVKDAIVASKDAFVSLKDALLPIAEPVAKFTIFMAAVAVWNGAFIIEGVARAVDLLVDSMWDLVTVTGILLGASAAGSLVKLTAACGSLMAALKFVAFAIKYHVIVGFGKLMATLGKSRIAMALTGATARGMWAAIGGPVGAVIAAIGLIAFAFIKLWKSSQDFREFWKDLWLEVVSAATGALYGITFGFGTMVKGILSTANFLVKGLGNIPFFGGAFKGAGEAIDSVNQDIDRLIDKTNQWARSAREAANAYDHVKDSAIRAAGAMGAALPPGDMQGPGLYGTDAQRLAGIRAAQAAAEAAAWFPDYSGGGVDTSTKGLKDFTGGDDAKKRAKDEAKKAAEAAKKAMKKAFDKILPDLKAIAKNIGKESTDQIKEQFAKLYTDMKDAKVSKSVVEFAKKQEKALLKLAKARDKVQDKLEIERDKLEALQSQYDDFYKKVRDDILNLANVTTTNYDTFEGIFWRMQRVLEVTQEWQKSIKALSKTNLDRDILQDIIEAGPTGGLNAANAILASGQDGIDALNGIQRDIEKIAGDMGKSTADTFYKQGVRMAEGIVKGLESQEAKLIKSMEKLADTLVNTIKKKLKIKSPSQVFEDEVGKMMAEGVTKGFGDNLTGVARTLSDLPGVDTGTSGGEGLAVNIIADGPTLQDIVRVEISKRNRAMKNNAMAGSSSGTMRRV